MRIQEHTSAYISVHQPTSASISRHENGKHLSCLCFLTLLRLLLLLLLLLPWLLSLLSCCLFPARALTPAPAPAHAQARQSICMTDCGRWTVQSDNLHKCRASRLDSCGWVWLGVVECGWVESRHSRLFFAAHGRRKEEGGRKKENQNQNQIQKINCGRAFRPFAYTVSLLALLVSNSIASTFVIAPAHPHSAMEFCLPSILLRVPFPVLPPPPPHHPPTSSTSSWQPTRPTRNQPLALSHENKQGHPSPPSPSRSS